MRRVKFLVVAIVSCLLINPVLAAQPQGPQHGLELYGSPKYAKDFKNFEYVNPGAPKGGLLTMGGVGTFDSLNPFVIKGVPAAGMSPIHPSYFYATLMEHSSDEPASSYGYIAQTVEVAQDGSSVTYTLRENAQFHDKTPILADDVVFSFNILKEKGNPFFKSYYRKVKNVEALGPRIVRFNFTVNDDKELPLITGEMPILSKTFYTKNDFTKANLTQPLGNGPYQIENVDAGKSITYKRVQDWWGADLPVNKGRYNFNSIKIIYFRDSTVSLEAFKAGEVDLRSENLAKDWVNSYDSPALQRGDYVKLEIPHTMPAGMSGFIFNLRKPMFEDIRVRKALSAVFDFEWANKNLFYNSYKRSNSYFSNCELASTGLPQGEELAILEPFRAQLPAEVFTQEFRTPVFKTPNDLRNQLKISRELLKEAGWEIKGDILVNKATQKPFEIEILLVNPEMERVLNSYIKNLKSLGIVARIRNVDGAQYEARLSDFDYEMIFNGFGQSITPGNEQEEFFGSKTADVKGSRNYIGIKNPVIDALAEKLIQAPIRESLVAHTRALDRVLLWGFYLVPGWHSGVYRIAHWKNYHSPQATPKYNLDLNAWWYEEEKK